MAPYRSDGRLVSRIEHRTEAHSLDWCDKKLPAAEVLGDAGRVKGVRRRGGTIEFGDIVKEVVIHDFEEKRWDRR